MLNFIVERENDTVEVLLLPNKDDGTYTYVNLTSGHICSCRFNTIEEALEDMKNRPEVINYYQKDKSSIIETNVGDNVLYFVSSLDTNGNKIFSLRECPIKRISINKKSTKVYTDNFSPIDLEELESNTRILIKTPSLILVHEPFLGKYGLKEKALTWEKNKGWERQGYYFD